VTAIIILFFWKLQSFVNIVPISVVYVVGRYGTSSSVLVVDYKEPQLSGIVVH
jgi:hypothetical protein